jgi:hypothetical protein
MKFLIGFCTGAVAMFLLMWLSCLAVEVIR